MAVVTREILRYDQLHRLGRHGWWRSLLGIVVAFGGTFLLAPLAVQLAFIGWWAATGQPVAERSEQLLDLSDPQPATLLYINLTLICAIPVVWFLTRVLHRVPIGWSSSVFRRIRWSYFLVCLAISVVALLATLAVGALLPLDTGDAAEVGLNEFTSTTRDFLLVVIFLTPFQAAAEEYLFRGYLLQAFGGLINARTVAVLGSALLFALAHGAGQSIPVFIDRFAFGIVSGCLVLITGGLEAAIAMHVLNNVFAFSIALAVGDMATTLNATSNTWWTLPTTLTQSVVYLVLASVAARWMGLSNTVWGRVVGPVERAA